MFVFRSVLKSYWIFRQAARVSIALYVIFALVGLSMPSDAQVSESEAVSDTQGTGTQAAAMVVLWSSASSSPNLVLTGMVRSTKEPTIFLVDGDGGHPSLLIGADQAGPGRLIPLSITARSLRIAGGFGETLWLGGVKNSRIRWTGGPVSEGYLAKLDRQGRVTWEREFGNRSQRSIQSLAPLPSGDIVVAGRDNERTWLARISGDGRIVWERYFGVRKGASITIAGDKIAVAAFESSPGRGPLQSDTYREDVGFWTFNDAGQLLDHRVIREGTNHVPGDYRGRLLTERSNDATYVFSEWEYLNAVKPLQVIKLSASSQPIWRKELPETVIQEYRKTWSCVTAVTILANGDPLVACYIAKENNITLFQLDSQTGAPARTTIQLPSPPPTCDERWPATRFLQQMSSGVVRFFGSPNPGIKDCAWIGQVSLTRLPSLK